ncbi:hypothetical protein Tco_1082593 [Tanacetum coccineum]|uniref:Uncharacterized protein n=1 Tax=Tanacetum coccineum TaxID=301880 RepID=A0ABQ5I127_9ASTR
MSRLPSYGNSCRTIPNFNLGIRSSEASSLPKRHNSLGNIIFMNSRWVEIVQCGSGGDGICGSGDNQGDNGDGGWSMVGGVSVDSISAMTLRILSGRILSRIVRMSAQSSSVTIPLPRPISSSFSLTPCLFDRFVLIFMNWTDRKRRGDLIGFDSTTFTYIDLVPLAEDTEVFKTDESAPTPPPPRSPRTKYASTLTPPSPPPSPLSPWSSPLPQIPSPPLPVLSPPLPLPSPSTHTSPTYVDAPLGYRAAMIRIFIALWKRARFTTPNSKFEVGESSTAVAARVMTAMEEVNKRVTDLAAT